MRWLLPRFASSPAPDPADSIPQVLAGHSVDISSPAEALRHFEYPGLAPPPSARVGDPKLKQRESQPLKLWHLWKFGTFAAMKGVYLLEEIRTSRSAGCYGKTRPGGLMADPAPQHVARGKAGKRPRIQLPHSLF